MWCSRPARDGQDGRGKRRAGDLGPCTWNDHVTLTARQGPAGPQIAMRNRRGGAAAHFRRGVTGRTIQAVESDRGREPKYEVGNFGGGEQRRDPPGGRRSDGTPQQQLSQWPALDACRCWNHYAGGGAGSQCGAPWRRRHARGARVRLIMRRADRHCCIALQRQHQREQQGKPEAQCSIEPHSGKTYHRSANNTREPRTPWGRLVIGSVILSRALADGLEAPARRLGAAGPVKAAGAFQLLSLPGKRHLIGPMIRVGIIVPGNSGAQARRVLEIETWLDLGYSASLRRA